MAKDIESTMQWKLDIAQFKANITDARRQISLANAEFKKQTAGAKTWAASITGLEAKLRQLGAVERSQKTILQELKNQYNTVSKEMGEASPEAQRLQVAIAQQEAAISKTEREIAEYGAQLEKLKAEEQQAESAFERLTSTIDEQESELEQLKQAYMNAKLDGNTEEAERLGRAIEELSTELNQNKVAMNEAADEANRLDHSMDGLDDSATKAGNGFSVFKMALGNLLSEGIQYLIEGLKELARETLEVGINFDSAMSKVGAISGATGAELDALRDKAKEMGATTMFSATEAADALTYMAMAGWKTEDMLNGLDGIMALAAASGEDLASTSDIVTDALTAFGLSAADSSHLADVLAAASANANTNVSMMGESFKYVAPIAGALGFSAEDTAEALGLMANAGIKSSQAGTSLRTIMNSLSNDITITGSALGEVTIQTTNADGSMRELSDILADCRVAFSGLTEAEQAQAAESLVGKNAMSGFLALVNAAPADVDKLSSAINNCDGAAESMAATMQDNLGGDITKMKSNLESLQLEIFERLEPALRKGVDALDGLINALKFVVDHATAFETVLGAVTAAVTAFLVAVKGATILTAITTGIEMLTGGFAALNAVMLANPIGLIIAAIAGLVAAFVILWNKSEAFRSFWIKLWNKVKEVATKFAKAVKKLFEGDLVDAIKKFLIFLVTLPARINQILGEALAFVITWVANMLAKAIEAGSKFVQNIVDHIKELPGKFGEFLGNVIDTVITWVGNLVSHGATAGSDFVKGVIDGLKNLASDFGKKLDEAISKIGEYISKFFSKGKEIAGKLIEGMLNAFSGIASKFTNVGKGIIDGIGAGIDANAYKIGRKLGNYAASWVNSTMAQLGINSPSKVFADKVGRAIPEGIEYGIEQEMPITERKFKAQLNGFINDMTVAANHAVGGVKVASPVGGVTVSGNKANNGGGQTVNFYQTIESPKAVDRLTIYRQTNSLLFGAKVRLNNV